MRLSFSSSIILVLLTGLVAAEIPSASDANVQARANVGNILEERWNEPHKTKPWHQPTHTHKPPNQYQPHKHPGDRCHYDKECNSWKCNKGKCVSKPGQGHHGNYCNDHGQCGSGLYCSTGKNTCQSKKPAGQSCATGNSCSSATCFRNKCINNHSIPLHKPCGGDSQCSGAAFCSVREGYKCKTQFSRSHVCSRDSVCTSGRCRRGKCE